MTAAREHKSGPAGADAILPDAQPVQAANQRADERAQAARSVGCPYRARYLRAEQSGAITRQSLAEVIAGLDVIAPQVLIPPPGERAAHTAGAQTVGQVVRAQLAAGMAPDRIEAPAESVLGARSGHPTPASEAFYPGYDETAATCTREARELEAGA